MSNRNRRQVQMWSQKDLEELEAVPIPARINCSRCQKVSPPTRFSTKQLNDLRYQIKTTGRYRKINCQTCSGMRIVEIQCTMCTRTKGLEEFARSQRAKPDEAKCYKCIEEQVNREPVNHARYQSDDPHNRTFCTPDHSHGDRPVYMSTTESDLQSSGWGSVNGDGHALSDGGVALADEFHRAASINGSISGTLIDTDSEVPYPGPAGANHAWHEVSSGRAGSWHSGVRSNTGGSRSNTSSFKPNAYGHSSLASNADTQHTYRSSVAEHSDTLSSSRFPKIPAYKPTGAANASAGVAGPVRSPFVRPSEDTKREISEDWKSEDGSDDEEDIDDDSDDSDGEHTII